MHYYGIGWQQQQQQNQIHLSTFPLAKSSLEILIQSPKTKTMTFFVISADDVMEKTVKLMKWLMELFHNTKIELMPRAASSMEERKI